MNNDKFKGNTGRTVKVKKYENKYRQLMITSRVTQVFNDRKCIILMLLIFVLNTHFRLFRYDY